MTSNQRIRNALLSLRLSVFLVMLLWTLDKFANPTHAAKVYENFYRIGGLGQLPLAAIGVVELGLLLLFAAGVRKRITYGLVLGLHAVSTLSSYRQYLDPFANLLFLAAWPMLAACFTLYVLRDLDTKWSLS